MAQRRAAEAEAKAQAGAAEAEAQAQADAGAYEADEAGADEADAGAYEAGAYEADAGAYEAEGQAQADARAYEAQLHQLQPELQQREQQTTDTQRLQHLQQQLQDLQQDELQRKEQQVAEQQQQLQQQQAVMHLREQQVAEQQHQLQQQQADMQQREQQVAQQHHQVQQQQADLQLREQQVAQQHHQVQQQQADLQKREQQVAQQDHQVQQQQADLQQREQQVAQQHHQVQLQQQLNRLQQQLEAHSGAELQRQVQQQLAAQQHLLQQQQADLLLRQQQVEKQRQDTTLAPMPRYAVPCMPSPASTTTPFIHHTTPHHTTPHHTTPHHTTPHHTTPHHTTPHHTTPHHTTPHHTTPHHTTPHHTMLVCMCRSIQGEASNTDGVSEGRDDGEGWVGKMDMRQLCLWSDGCASQFKGAKAIKLHWHLANRFGVPVQWSYGATSHFKSTHDSEGGVAKREWREQMLVHPELVGKVCGAAVLTDWANKHFAVPCHAQDTSASHRQRGHIMRRRYLVLDDARQAGVCSMPEADVERMHDKVEGCRAMHRMVFTPDREQPQWAMAACACSTCMSVPCLPCMKPDTTTPLEPMPMFQDTVKEVYDDEECYALLMWFHPDLLHDEVCFGKLTNTHCARYCQHMGLDRPKERRKLRRLVVRELRSEQLEFEYEVNRLYG
ncbi:hypothetical protein QJQ45_012957 [Haematococcus lacustris]|nr:hypothetical protein QJQ45_012957 [Haematococcus lacustris]